MKKSIEVLQGIVDDLIKECCVFMMLKNVKVKVFHSGQKTGCFAEPVIEQSMFGTVNDVYMGIGVGTEVYEAAAFAEGSKNLVSALKHFMYHELTHIVQLYEGWLVFNNNQQVVWRNEKFDISYIKEKYHIGGDYSEFPWEVQAYEATEKHFPMPGKFRMFFTMIRVGWLQGYYQAKLGKCVLPEISLVNRLSYVHDTKHSQEDYIKELRNAVTIKSDESEV